MQLFNAKTPFEVGTDRFLDIRGIKEYTLCGEENLRDVLPVILLNGRDGCCCFILFKGTGG